MEVPGTLIGPSFFEFELKPPGKDSADEKSELAVVTSYYLLHIVLERQSKND